MKTNEGFGMRRIITALFCTLFIVGMLGKVSIKAAATPTMHLPVHRIEIIDYTESELEWIGSHRFLRVGYMKDYMPFCGQNHAGAAVGLVPDLLREILISIGLDDRIELDFVAFSGFAAMAEAVRTEEIDISFPVIGEQLYLDEMGITATNEVINIPMYVAYSGIYSDKTFDKIALNSRPIQRIKMYYPASETIRKDTAQECLDAVLSGEATCTVMASYRMKEIMNDSKYDVLNVNPFGASVPFCIGVNKEDAGLLSLMNRGVEALDKAIVTDNLLHIIDSGYRYSVKRFVGDNRQLVTVVAIALAALIVAALLLFVHGIKRIKKAINVQIEENKELATNLKGRDLMLQSISKVYFATFYIDIQTGRFEEISSLDALRRVIGVRGNAQRALYMICDNLVEDEKSQAIRKFVDLSTIDKRLKDKDVITCDYKGVYSGWSQMYLIACDRFEDGRIKTLLVASRRIAEEKAREEEQNRHIEEARIAAEHANNAKTTFLFNMSHDIRTPMNAIIGFTNLLEKNIDNPEKRSGYLDKIKDSSEVLLSIINNVLEMSRIERGIMELDETAVDAESLNDSIFCVFAEVMTQKDITFTRRIDVQHQYIFCDTTKLREIFFNILSNAYKYTNKGGSVKMLLEEVPCDKPGYVMFCTTISDTGVGMSEEFLPHIFEEFTREHNTTANKIEGTGLGMPIVKKLLDTMGGSIEVMSSKGVGTTFIMKIPHKIADESEVTKTETVEISPERFVGKRILLAEDNDLNAEIAMDILSDVGFEVERAEDGLKCLEKIKVASRDHYDAVLMDIQMPNMDGYEAAKAIRRLLDTRKARIPILAMTANAFEEDRRQAFKCGMNGHLAKPIDVKKLMKELSYIITS